MDYRRQVERAARSSLLSELAEKLPYVDGSSRRRFLAGGLALSGWGVSIGFDVQQLASLEITRIPLVAVFAGLVVYLVGTVVELLGNLLVVRAAGGTLTAIGTFRRRRRGVLPRLRLLTLPFSVVVGALSGVAGRKQFSLSLKTRLTSGGRSALATLPEQVVAGLDAPLGDAAELATHVVTERLRDESNRRWARRMYSRSRDIGVATTAVIFGFIPAAVAVIASQTSVSVAEPYEKPTGSSFAGEAAVLAQSIGLAQTIDAWSSSPVELELRQIAFAIGEAAHRRGASAIDVDALRARLVETADGSGRTFSTRTRRMIDGLVSLMDSWYWHRLYLGDSPAHEVAERATRVAQLGLIAAVVFVPLLLLYAGFFWSVRIATVGAVELLAIESEADAIDTEPESLDSRLMATG